MKQNVELVKFDPECDISTEISRCKQCSAGADIYKFDKSQLFHSFQQKNSIKPNVDLNSEPSEPNLPALKISSAKPRFQRFKKIGLN